MSPTMAQLDFAREGDTLIVTLLADLDERHHEQFEDEANEVVNLLGDPSIQNVVLDFGPTDDISPWAVEFFTRLSEKVQCRSGRMALCHASEYELELLRGTGLDGRWPVFRSRGEAVAAMRD